MAPAERTGRPGTAGVTSTAKTRLFLVAGITVLVLAGVFVLPWIVPVAERMIVSDSQAAGFNNRVAMLALAIGVVLVFFVSSRQERDGGTTDFLSLRPVPPEQRVNRWLLWGGICGVIGMVVVLGTVLGDHLYADGLYFTSALLRAKAGAVPFRDMEFSYGPLQFYYPYLVWKLLGSTEGSLYPVYYACVASFHVLGLSLGAFIVNRLSMPRMLRNVAFVFVGLSGLLGTLGLSYTPVRYLLPYALYLGVLVALTKRRLAKGAILLPLLAFVVSAGVSPEVGLALLFAFTLTLLYLGRYVARKHYVTLFVLWAGTAMALLLVSSRTFDAFAGGSYYFPVLPSLVMLIYIVGVLSTAYGAGRAAAGDDALQAAAHIGWLGMVIVFIAPAFGRADIWHIVWNGLGAVLSGAAVLSRKPLRSYLLVGADALIFTGVMAIGIVGYHMPRWNAAAIDSIMTTEARSQQFAELVGGTAEGGSARFQDLEAARLKSRVAADRLTAVPRLAYINWLADDLGGALAFHGDLVPHYLSHPEVAITVSDYQLMIRQLGEAENMAILTSELNRMIGASQNANADSDGVVMVLPKTVGGKQGGWDYWLGFPLECRGRHRVFDPVASFGAYLEKNWVAYDTVGDFTLLHKR